MAGSDSKLAKFMINALAETPEDVASFLVPEIRKFVAGESSALGDFGEALPQNVLDMLPKTSYIKFLTLPKAYAQIILKGLFGIRNNRYIQE
mmetsp:Transcript_7708/g.19654  ORF Transcript_7708/g.19654 Transcript_7708/m.19654 type:complete len:92 (+) Transcript_7708:714-989(+)